MSDKNIVNFDISVSRTENDPNPENGSFGTFEIRATTAKGDERERVQLPFLPEHLAPIYSSWGFERYKVDTRGSIPMPKGLEEKSPQEIGKMLFGFLFPGKISTLLERVSAGDDIIRLRLKLDLDCQSQGTIERLPWELIHRPRENTPLLRGNRFQFVRVPELSHDRKDSEPAQPKRVLILAPQVQGNRHIHSQPAIEDIDKTWKEVGLELKTLHSVTRRQLAITMEEFKPDMVYFFGHGTKSQQKWSLIFNSENINKPDTVDSNYFCELMTQRANPPKLVVLAACESGRSSDGEPECFNPFNGLAKALIQEGVQAVVAMQAIVPVSAATAFLKGFNQHLAEGKPIEMAMGRGRVEIHNANSKFHTWFVPVLYLVQQKGPLFDFSLLKKGDGVKKYSPQPNADAASIFLNFVDKDKKVMKPLVQALKKYGVSIWTDKEAALGSSLQDNWTRALQKASAYVAYLTDQALADPNFNKVTNLAIQRHDDFGLQIVPIYGGEQQTHRSTNNGEHTPGIFREFQAFHGETIPQDLTSQDLRSKLGETAENLLHWHLEGLSKRPKGTPLQIGAITRNNDLSAYGVDLQMNWQSDFEQFTDGQLPADYFDKKLAPICKSILKATRKRLPGRGVRIIPHCHLTMALALGFTFQRNAGIDIEVLEPNGKELWAGPYFPENGLPQYWREQVSADHGGQDLAIGVSVAAPPQRVEESIANWSISSGTNLAKTVIYSPKSGDGKNVMKGMGHLKPHQLAVGLADLISKQRATTKANQIHLFVATPVAFAVLLGQQLANLGTVVVYEHLREQSNYRSTFTFTEAY